MKYFLIKIILLFILFYIFSYSFTLAQKTLEVNAKSEVENFSDYIFIFEDKTTKLKDEDIIIGKYDSLFSVPKNLNLNYGISKSSFWLKFKLKNTQPSFKNGVYMTDNEWFLEHIYPMIDTIVLYHSTKNSVSKGIAGLNVLKKKHTFRYFNYTFPIQLNDNEEHIFYIKINTNGVANLSCNLKTSRQFEQDAFVSQLFYGLFFGSLMVMFFYNLFIYFVVKNINYLYYCAYLLFYALSQFTIVGYGYEYIWYDNAKITKLLLSFTIHIDIVFIFLFSFNFLEIKKTATLLHKYRNLFIVYSIYSVFSVFFMPLTLYILITMVWIFSATSFLFIVGIYVWWFKNAKYAKYYVLGWSVFFIGLSIQNAINIGLLADSELLHHIHKIGSVIEMLFFSFALADQINFYRAETIKISQENEKILTEQNKILEVKVKERTQKLEASQEELNHAYFDIRASIHYAKNIQTAMLVPVEIIKKHLTESFILWKPRDIVSGDFYWFSQLSDDKVMLAAIDCTGHGIPGAFMSLISNDLMTEIVEHAQEHEPNIVLEKMHKGIRSILKQKETNNRDGMDISLCMIDKKKKEVVFAGAGNPILYVQNNELHQIKGNVFGIGGEQKEVERTFEKYIINAKNDTDTKTNFYIFSDGFQDQFGGAERKKFGSKRMRELLLEIQNEDMPTQQKLLDDKISEWIKIGGEKQIDDILLIGFRI